MLTASTLHHPHHVAEHVVQGQRWLLFTAESYAQHIATVVLCLCSDVIRCGGEDDDVLKISYFLRNVAHGHKYRVLKQPDGRKNERKIFRASKYQEAKGTTLRAAVYYPLSIGVLALGNAAETMTA